MNPLDILTAPLTADEIEWKIISNKGGITSIAPYIDARAVMVRLDKAFGPFGWQVRYFPAQVSREDEDGKNGVITGIIASILVRDPNTGEWVEKQDGSGPSDMEPFKGAISGGFEAGRRGLGHRAGTLHLPPDCGGGGSTGTFPTRCWNA